MASLEDQTTDPDRYNGAIPCTSNIPVSIQNVDGRLSLKVTASGGSRPNNASGALVANLRSGFNSLDVMYPAPVPAVVGGFVTMLTYPAYVKGDVVKVSPDLSETMSVGRLAAARIKLESATQSTTSASLSGEVGAAAIADYRDLNQWSQSELKSLAMSSTSAVMGCSLSKPLYMFLGPDVASGIEPIESIKALETGRNLYTRIDGAGISNNATIGFGFSFRLGATTQVWKVGRIPPRSRVRASFAFTNIAVDAVVTTSINSYWIKAATSPDTAPSVVERRADTTFKAGPNAAPYRTSVIYHGDDDDLIETGYELMGLLCNTTTGQIGEIEVEVLDYYADRQYAGWRVAVWNDLGLDQNLVITFNGAVEGLPTGQLAYYRRSDDLKSVSFMEWTEFRRLFSDNVLTRIRHEVATLRPPMSSTLDRSVQMGLFQDIGRGLGGLLTEGLGTIGKVAEGAIGMSGMQQGRMGVPTLRMAGMPASRLGVAWEYE